MIEVEESLSELKKAISAWPSLTSKGLEPQQGLMIMHLEDMLSCLEQIGSEDDDTQTNSNVLGEDAEHREEDMGENEVPISLLYLRKMHLLNSFWGWWMVIHLRCL